jgi:hypothetical protein
MCVPSKELPQAIGTVMLGIFAVVSNLDPEAGGQVNVSEVIQVPQQFFFRDLGIGNRRQVSIRDLVSISQAGTSWQAHAACHHCQYAGRHRQPPFGL